MFDYYLDYTQSHRSSLVSINFPSDFQNEYVSEEDKIVIMKSIQMGLEYSLTKGIGSTVECDLLFKDFNTVEVTVFKCNKVGDDLKPFKFKSYAPVAFRHFRTKFGIEQDDYLTSFCNSPLRELSNPGASGSMFFITRDDEFIMKTINHGERKFLSDLLPGYLMNLNQNPYTLLPKFFGFYCYKVGKNYHRFVAMNNFIPSDIKMHQKYDLKGSTYKRFASKTEKQKISPTYKDVDFKEHHPNGIFLEPATHKLLIKTINRDCRVLESFRIMDYSLLLGVHNKEFFEQEEKELRANRLHENVENGTDTALKISSTLSQTAETDKDVSVDNLMTVDIDLANARNYSDKDFILSRNGIPATSGKGEKLLLFIGIVDILENYGAKKKLELRVKSLLNDKRTISTQKPSFYASRFLNFIETYVI